VVRYRWGQGSKGRGSGSKRRRDESERREDSVKKSGWLAKHHEKKKKKRKKKNTSADIALEEVIRRHISGDGSRRSPGVGMRCSKDNAGGVSATSNCMGKKYQSLGKVEEKTARPDGQWSG